MKKGTEGLENAIWYKCISCGSPCAFFYENEMLCAAHSKPTKYMNIPNTVQCEFWNQHSAGELWNMFFDRAEILPSPESVTKAHN